MIKPSRRQLLLTAVLLAAAFPVLLILVGNPTMSGAETKPLLGDSVAATAVQTTASAPLSTSGDRGDGIKVHGHWTIVLLNADGTVGETRDFENALTANGAGVLSQALGRKATGLWSVELTPSTFVSTNGACDQGNGTHGSCWLLEPPSNVSPGEKSLVVSSLTTGPDANKLRLSGSVTATLGGTIDIVRTYLGQCAGIIAPDSCMKTEVGGPSFAFTGKGLTSPIAVQPGQQIQVTVLISFS
ncbi:MAG: hypothetical protein E6J52_10650 [Chloroflexi bacterium]|nr:MAG: hypothetical protein E6J52_10650 [Chloroflexota bacterium]